MNTATDEGAGYEKDRSVKTMKYENMYVKEISKTEKNKEDGVEIQYKLVMEQISEQSLKIVNTSDEEFDVKQGEKDLTIEMKNPQTRLN